MDNNELCEHTKIRLIAAAVDHQQCTKTGACVIPLPGTDRVIAIGAPADVERLLGAHAGVVANDTVGTLDRWKGHEIMNDPSLDCVEFVRLDEALAILAAPAAQAPVQNAEKVRIASLEAQLAQCVALSQKWAAAAGEADGRAEKARAAALEEAKKVFLAKLEIRAAHGFAREASTARQLAEEIAALASKEAAAAEAPVNRRLSDVLRGTQHSDDLRLKAASAQREKGGDGD